MTRAEDVFVSLDKRLKFSRDSGADLFISLHADSIEEKVAAGSIRGATIYTLSSKASDDQARIMAEKENASDLLAGIESYDKGNDDQVKNILIDLMKRETSNFSADFSQVLAKRLGKTIEMSRVPRRSAAFKVLKQTDAPSVLVELGYISNQTDEEQMLTPEWQSKVADAVAGAVQIYFNKRTAARP
jgi:N-acetylmuramoyl-L-alanine amidase